MFFRTHLSVAVIVALFAAGGTWRLADIHHQREIGRREIIERTQDSILTVQSHRIDSLKAAFHTDTVRLARTLVRYDSIKDTLQVVLHDTTVKRDTLIQVVERYRERADSTIQDCRFALARCVQLSLHQDTLVESLRHRSALERQGRPGFLSTTASAVKWLGIGVAVGYVAAKH